jgi:hypothetical protein
MSRLPYKEGDVFAVPLRNGGFGLGVIARVAKGGRVLLGYFFGPRLQRAPTSVERATLRPQDAIKVVRFGDLSLMNGAWPLIGSIDKWDRKEWQMPRFYRRDELSKRAWLIAYSDDNPAQEIGKEASTYGATGYEQDALLGAGAVELVLTRSLRSEPTDR